MTILTEKYKFIRDDVFLCPQIDTETGKQTLKIQKINIKTGKIEFKDQIDCIHTVVNKISAKEYKQFQIDRNFQEKIIDKSINVRSSEKFNNLKIPYLNPEEKFKAFKSWAAGIAEAGIKVFEFQIELESILPSIYPIFSFLMKFLIKIDTDFIFNYLFKIEQECVFNNKRHNPSFIASLQPVLHWLESESEIYNSEIMRKVVDVILDLNPPFKIFEHFSDFNNKVLSLILINPNATKYSEFKTYFNHKDPSIRQNVARNPEAVKFDEYRTLFNDENRQVRCNAASNKNAVKFKEYRTLFHDEDSYVRENAARNTEAVKLEGFKNLFYDENISVCYAAFTNPGSKIHKEYFLIQEDKKIQMDFAIHWINWDYIKNFAVSAVNRYMALSEPQKYEVNKDLSLIFYAFKKIAYKSVNTLSHRDYPKEIVEIILSANIPVYLFEDIQEFIKYIFRISSVHFNDLIKDILNRIEMGILDRKKLSNSFYDACVSFLNFTYQYIEFEEDEIYIKLEDYLNNFETTYKEIVKNLLKLHLFDKLILSVPSHLFIISKTDRTFIIQFFIKLKEELKEDYSSYIKKISSLNEELLEVICRQSGLSRDYKFIIKTALSGLSGLTKLQFMIKSLWYKIRIKMTKMIKILNIIDLWARFKTRRRIKGILDSI